ncbi:CLUMA_CG014256, isoform A [Clunio marinus]|uniref:CLUMA_CG014256, isoform A n=1 Tax=Clunio marinus TaxID=568069 RepID=A0A1J1IN44_9DIPT|nr:CLUMA_CG014256, isoform A [Clunio marinus]
MNPHYHPYSDLSSPHPPSPDNNNYPPLSHHNGHSTLSQMDGHHQGFHHMNGTMKHCAGCGGKIMERYFLHALDRYWHNSCLKCSCCGAMLADIGTSCFTRSGMILCKADYSRLFGNSGACSACGQMIPANELVMRTTSNMNQNGVNNNTPANNQNIQHFVFHLKCFSCSKCGSHLVQGDRYYMLAGSLVCEQDWHKLVKTAPTPTPPLRKGKIKKVEDDQQHAHPPILPSVILEDDSTRNLVIPRLHHHQSIMARSPNEGLYNNLYDKDMGLMRKLMNLDEFQCPSSMTHTNNNNINSNCVGLPNNDMIATKQFHQYPNGIFNGKFANSSNFPFPFDKPQQQQQQQSTNGIRHDGLLKPCYDFPLKSDAIDDNFGSNPISVGGFKKQQQQASIFTSSGFMNQFPHESLFSANNHHSTFTKLNEINNNNGGGMVVKMENDFNTMHMNSKQNELLCSRSSNNLNKTEPNEFRNSSCKSSGADNTLQDDDENKSSTLHDESNDGFTQL